MHFRIEQRLSLDQLFNYAILFYRRHVRRRRGFCHSASSESNPRAVFAMSVGRACSSLFSSRGNLVDQVILPTPGII
ncbi:hypothetical protein PUN28_015813 [Cardiocondyla obscurior]|uniref:Uncharacterized protein n=1 Tax=Cardiocondyla obscurior TaxID=286306 RepID=A0AAW2ET77_9HYME